MEREREVPAAESEAHRLVINNFRRFGSGSSVINGYFLRTHLMIQLTKVFLPPTFPQSSGQSRATKGGNQQRRTYNCGSVTVV